jgi:hypothetical protein
MKPIDFQGIITFDRVLVEQLHNYLNASQSHLARCVIHAIHPLSGETLPPELPVSDSEEPTLRDAVQNFGKRIALIASHEKPLVGSKDWELAMRQINTALWEYVEVLESCVTELFQQLNQVGFEQWHSELMKVVVEVKEALIRRMDECEWMINRMEPLLWDYRKTCEKQSGKRQWWKKILTLGSSLVDRSLLPYLKKSRRYLKIQSKWFSQRYADYIELKKKIEQSLRKFKGYHVFAELDEPIQQDFKKVYELLKLWQLNLKTKSLPAREPIRALRSGFSMDKTAQIFTEYYRELAASLYEKSRKIKDDSEDLYRDVSSRRFFTEVIKGIRAEIHTLGATIESFREFDLRTHPNPYVRNRWGFTEWVVGPEPEKTRELLDLVYEVELLDKLFEKLGTSVEKGPSSDSSQQLSGLYREIERTLHEMGQPLSSRVLMRSRAEKILEQLEEVDELGSFNPEVVDLTGMILSKAMRADWQYNVLYEITQFHQLYRIHQGLLGQNEDRKHLSRLNKFREIIKELEGWVTKCATHRHVHEIEVNMNDIRGYLQDFLGRVQQMAGHEESDADSMVLQINEVLKKLLEYRYLFGSFFHMLHQHEPEGKLIRNQFLFVDQYFEAVESLLQEMRGKWCGTQQV